MKNLTAIELFEKIIKSEKSFCEIHRTESMTGWRPNYTLKLLNKGRIITSITLEIDDFAIEHKPNKKRSGLISSPMFNEKIIIPDDDVERLYCLCMDKMNTSSISLEEITKYL